MLYFEFVLNKKNLRPNLSWFFHERAKTVQNLLKEVFGPLCPVLKNLRILNLWTKQRNSGPHLPISQLFRTPWSRPTWHPILTLSLYHVGIFLRSSKCWQVSTWFANARRRLKKENKMTWEPKNKLDDDDVDVSDDDDKDVFGDDKTGEIL